MHVNICMTLLVIRFPWHFSSQNMYVILHLNTWMTPYINTWITFHLSIYAWHSTSHYMNYIPPLHTCMTLLYLHPFLLSIFLSPCQTSVPAATDRKPPILKETENKQAEDIKVDKEESTNYLNKVGAFMI